MSPSCLPLDTEPTSLGHRLNWGPICEPARGQEQRGHWICWLQCPVVYLENGEGSLCMLGGFPHCLSVSLWTLGWQLIMLEHSSVHRMVICFFIKHFGFSQTGNEMHLTGSFSWVQKTLYNEISSARCISIDSLKGVLLCLLSHRHDTACYLEASHINKERAHQ